MVKFYQVGGCVRDALLGIKSKDIDFTVVAPSYEAMKEAIIAKGCDIKVEKPEFATIRAIHPELKGVDFVLARKEGKYSDGRHPDSVEIGTLADDIFRRDFTVNGLAEDEDGQIIDLVGGIYDLNERVLRCIGGTERLIEDSLRMLRAIRFQITKGFTPDAELESFLREANNADLLANLPVERIRDEVLKCFEFDTNETFRIFARYNAIRFRIFERNLKLVPTIFKK